MHRIATRRALATSALLAALLAGCTGAAVPTATPQDMTGVITALVLRGATVRQVVAGDAGCSGSHLHSNAARIDLALSGSDREHSVYLFRWRRAADYDAAADSFAACVAEHAAQSPTPTAEVVEVRPWRAYGTGWARELNAVLHDALRAAGG